MMLAESTLCSVLPAAPLVRGIYCSAITESTFIPFTADHHVWVSVCIFTEMKFQKAYMKTESPWPIGLCQHPTIASFLWPKLLFPNLNQQKSASQYHARSAVKASWNLVSSNCMRNQFAFHVMRSNRSLTKTLRQVLTSRAAEVWGRIFSSIKFATVNYSQVTTVLK